MTTVTRTRHQKLHEPVELLEQRVVVTVLVEVVTAQQMTSLLALLATTTMKSVTNAPVSLVERAKKAPNTTRGGIARCVKKVVRMILSNKE